MCRTQHWVIALLLTTTLLSVGVIITLLNQKSADRSAPIASEIASLTTGTMPKADIKTVSTGGITETVALEKANQLMPQNKIEGIQKVNYEGKLAYQITTAENSIYLDAKTGDVLIIMPRASAKPETVQVSYQTGHDEYERYEHEEEGEHDDD